MRQEKSAKASTGHWQPRNGECPDFCFLFSVLRKRPSVGLGKFQTGRLIMYIGGGLVTLVIIVLVVVFLVRGF